MASPVIRISPYSRRILEQCTRLYGVSMQVVLDDALEVYRRNRFLTDTNSAFLSLRKNKRLFKQELQERTQWEATLSDTSPE